MLGFDALDVFIGLSAVYLLVSLMCSVAQEFLSAIIGWRSKTLRKGIQTMLADPNFVGLARRFYSHPRVNGLSPDGSLPSYISADTFSSILVDILESEKALTTPTSGPLAPFVRAAQGDVTKLKQDLSSWFDEGMDRVSGWYKRQAHLVLFLFGLIIAIGLNVDTLVIARTLWVQPTLRQSVVGRIEKMPIKIQPADGNVKPAATDAKVYEDEIKSIQGAMNGLTLPIGWTYESFKETRESMQKIGIALVGWLITALAVSVGSQFWFNTLGQALKLRMTGTKPPESTTTSS